MRFLRNLFLGYRAYWKALWMIREYKLYYYILFPAALMLIIYQLGFALKLHIPKMEVNNMNEIIWFMIRLMGEILLATALMRFAKYMVVILLSPLFSKISQKIEFVLTGNTYSFSFPQLISDIRRGMRIGIRNIVWELFFFTIIFLIGIIGWGDFFDSPVRHILFFISFYYYGFSFMDYVHERLLLNISQSVKLARSNRGIALAIGSVYSVLIWSFIDLSTLFDWSTFQEDPGHFLFIFCSNLVVWIAASFAPIWAIVAATIAMHDLLDLKQAKYSFQTENEMNK
jgi:CysZ protein